MQTFSWLLGAAILAVGCGPGTGETTTSGGELDAGPDVVVVVLDGGGAPATPPDGASLCPQGVCNYQTGAGCPADHPSCIPSSDASGAVAPSCLAAGPGASGAACAQASDCAAGFLCANAACRKLCCGGDWTGCSSPSEHCIERLVYSNPIQGGTTDTKAMLCTPVNTCDALVPSSCAQPGTTCQLADPTGATACLAEGQGTAGEACPCKGGFACIVGDKGSECRRLCKAVEGGGEPYCQSGEGVCTHFTRDPSGVGECTP